LFNLTAEDKKQSGTVTEGKMVITLKMSQVKLALIDQRAEKEIMPVSCVKVGILPRIGNSGKGRGCRHVKPPSQAARANYYCITLENPHHG